MIKKFDEFVNEGLLDIFTGDGCKNLETICSAFQKRFSSISPIKFKWKSNWDKDSKIITRKLDYSKSFGLEFISADDDLVINKNGKRTIKEEAKRLVDAFKNDIIKSDVWNNEDTAYKYITRFLYKSSDTNLTFKDIKNKETAIFIFTIPYLKPVEGEKDLFELETYLYRTSSMCHTRGRDDKQIANTLLNNAFYRLYKGLTDPDDEIDEFLDVYSSKSLKDIRQYIPSEVINLVKKYAKKSNYKVN